MTHTIHYNPDEHIIETKVLGNLTKDEADVIIVEISTLAAEKKLFSMPHRL